jgi:hypothetical protein
MYPLNDKSSSLNEKCYFLRVLYENLFKRRLLKKSKLYDSKEDNKGIYSVEVI